MTYVYWIKDETCTDVTQHGYVGVSEDVEHRFLTHVRKGRVPQGSMVETIFEGTREDCFNKELELRPVPFIRWNNARGGSHGWRYGFKHSTTTRDKMKNAWDDDRKAAAAIVSRERNASLKGQKRPKQSKSMSSDKNPMLGKTHSNEARAKISAANKGRVAPNKSATYCVICGKQAPPSILKKYHGLNKKRCKST